MLTGIWIIEADPPPGAVKLCDEYLPPGTRIRLVVGGPTRLAIEEERDNELGGTLDLLPPVPPAVCATGLGAETVFGWNVCRDGKLKAQAEGEPSFDAVFTFERLSAADLADPDNAFFVEQGARVGANFTTVELPHKSVQWGLWLRGPNQMVSECLATLPGKDNITSFPLVWRREPGR